MEQRWLCLKCEELLDSLKFYALNVETSFSL